MSMERVDLFALFYQKTLAGRMDLQTDLFNPFNTNILKRVSFVKHYFLVN